jgi:hypothetical protein
MADEAAFHAWLCDALSRVKLEDEAYVGYVESILKEDTYQPDEKKDAVLEFLASSSVLIAPPPPIDDAPYVHVKRWYKI